MVDRIIAAAVAMSVIVLDGGCDVALLLLRLPVESLRIAITAEKRPARLEIEESRDDSMIFV